MLKSIHPTDEFVSVNDQLPARIWRGETAKGVEVLLVVVGVIVERNDPAFDESDFAALIPGAVPVIRSNRDVTPSKN